MILYKPLEEVLADLEKQAKLHDKKGFVQTSIQFYACLGELGRMGWIPEIKPCIIHHYQTRYEQLKLLLGAREQ